MSIEQSESRKAVRAETAEMVAPANLAEATQQLLAAIVMSSDDAIVSKTLDGIITSWNIAATRLFGYSAEEAIGRSITLIIPPERLQEEVEILSNLRQGMKIDHFETERVTKEGRRVQVSLSISPVKDSHGVIVGAAKIARDITQRKRAEQQEHFLSEVSRLLSSTLDYQETLSNIARLVVPQMADWFAVDLVDDAGHFVLTEIEHQDPQKVGLVRAYRERFPIDPDAPSGLSAIVRTGQSELYTVITDEMLVAVAKSQEELDIARLIGMRSAMSAPLIARGKITGVVTYISSKPDKAYDERDLALAEEVGRRAGVALDNARLHREVQQARDQLEIILHGVADGIIVYARDGSVVYANQTAASVMGSSSVEEFMRESPLSTYDRFEVIDEQGQPFARSQLTYQRVLAGESEAEAIIGFAHKMPGQPEYWTLSKSRPVYDAQGSVQYVITILHDITEMVQAEHRKDEFISMASHELKTPVTSLKGFSYVLRRRLSSQSDEQGLYYLTRMDTQVDKLTRLVSDLLDISRMQTGVLELRKAPFELDALIAETVENVQAVTPTHHLQIESASGARVFGDKDRLEQVFINLLNNAIKYSPEASKVFVHLSREHGKAVVRVQDFGIGIDEDSQQRIFDRFYQVADSEGRTYPGLGIGLYISKGIVERHNGRIEVESYKGQGTTFTVRLPVM